MKYQPVTCVWEVTMGCNMRCGHCGSSCEQPLSDELTTEEALDVCNQIADLGLRWVTLSGGEPLTRKDISLIIRRLSEKGVAVNLITNGWMLTEEKAKELKENGISTVAISIDGTEKIHDKIRKKGAFEHAGKAFSALKSQGIKTGAITTITNQNLEILENIKKDLLNMGVDSWQVQLGLPMGNLKKKPDWVIEPENVDDIIEFCYQTANEGEIKIYPADCIGYYTKKEIEIKQYSYETPSVSIWDGCNAGIRGFGILQNGDILGCTSIRDKSYIEGNIRERPLREIWDDPQNFLWRRDMTKDKLEGNCKTCAYGSKCLGGCPNTRLTMNRSMNSENQYCAYNLSMKRTKELLKKSDKAESLFQAAEVMIKHQNFQEAAFNLERACELDKENDYALTAKAYAEYMCGNYDTCIADNKKALELNPENANALQGYSTALYRTGNKDAAIKMMQEALVLSDNRADIYNDLQAMVKGI